jgi:drug/metabolite transporter (DMT)-like permease
MVGGLCALSFLLLIAALAEEGSGRMLGVRNASVAFALLFALALGERPSPRQWGGIGLLVLGVLVLAVEPATRGE